MIEIVKFKAEHILSIRKQDHDVIELASYRHEHYEKLAECRYAWTIIVNGVIRACVGVVEYWDHRGEAWAFIDKRIGMDFLAVIRGMKGLFQSVDLNRIEATVIKNFKQGHRLVKILGFELEADLMRKYGVTGLDYSLYARVK